jgi:hypothetical protein
VPLIALLVIVLSAAAVAGFLAYRTLSAERVARTRLEAIVRAVEAADARVVVIDEAVRSQVTSDSVEQAEAALVSVEAAASQLKDSLGELDQLTEDLSASDLERAVLLRGAVDARLEMLAQAPAVLGASTKAARSLPLAESAWTRLLEAKRISDRAVASYNKLTRAGVEESRRLNRLAQKELLAAREGFAAAEKAFPEVAFEAYLAYVDSRVSLNEKSLESDAAWLGGRLAEANRIIESYNTLDAKAVAQAKALPASPAAAVAAAYEAIADAATDEYYAARERATEADAKLRGE